MITTGGRQLARALQAAGIETVFGIPGTHNLEIFAGLSAQHIRVITPRHEQGGGYAADGMARVSDQPAVLITTTGPAALNAASALLQAYTDSVPVLLITPGMPTGHPGRGNGLLHEVINQAGALRNVIDDVHRVESVAEIPQAVAQTLSRMLSGRPRPAAIEIPLDLIEAEGEAELWPVVVSPAPAVAPQELQRAQALLTAATRPLIIVGAGAAAAGPQVTALAETLAAPVITTSNGKGIISDDHPLCIGAVGGSLRLHELVSAADAVLAVGTELAGADFADPQLVYPQALVRIDIDEVAALTNARPEVALICDAHAGLTALHTALTSQSDSAQADPPASSPQANGLPAWATTAAEVVRQDAQRAATPWDWVARAITAAEAQLKESDHQDTRTVIAADSTMSCYYGLQTAWSAHTRSSFLYPAGAGTLGYGLPAGIGAKLARPHDRVLVVEGDGGAMFTIQELATAVELGISLPILIVDNGGYGEIRNEMVDRGDDPTSVALRAPDFRALAAACGATGTFASGAEELTSALVAAWQHTGPTLIHIYESSRAADDMLHRTN